MVSIPDRMTFQMFNYHIRSTVTEYLNNIQQHSHENLTEFWWTEQFNMVCELIKNKTSPIIIQDKIIENALRILPENLLDSQQINQLYEFMNVAFASFIDSSYRTHFCNIQSCVGDCGYQSCGICIDVCRCATY
jgi:hypothetical protein